jgi:hypothetical protein
LCLLFSVPSKSSAVSRSANVGAAPIITARNLRLTPSITRSPWKVRSSGETNIPTIRNNVAARTRKPWRATVNGSGSGIRSVAWAGLFLVDHSLIRKLKIYTEPSLLVVDELGYLSLDQQTSNLFYQVISTRHSHKRSTLITTNTAFSDWGNILYNTTIATAIADRLVENSEIFLLGGESLRKGNKSQPPTE